MKSVIATALTGALAFLALLSSPSSAQQMFPAGGSGGTSCPGGSSYAGSDSPRRASDKKVLSVGGTSKRSSVGGKA
jgi:hypothetical protein